MKHNIEKQFILICEEILAEDKTPEEWAEIESDDMFQSSSYSGGYDADEEAFCFSYYANDGEYWFQLTLTEIDNAINGKLKELEITKADL